LQGQDQLGRTGPDFRVAILRGLPQSTQGRLADLAEGVARRLPLLELVAAELLDEALDLFTVGGGLAEAHRPGLIVPPGDMDGAREQEEGHGEEYGTVTHRRISVVGRRITS